MILLDTNVVSELFQPRPNPIVCNWLVKNDERLLLNAVTLAELAYGIAMLSDGRRKAALQAQFDRVEQQFLYKTIPFTAKEAVEFGPLRAKARLRGRPMSVPDCQIAAIAKVLGVPLATRNTRDFELCGLELINPWDVA